MKYKILSLPIETKSREFLGKLLLSARAVDNGWIVFLGQVNVIRPTIPHFLPGVHVENGIQETKYERVLLPFTGMGHKIVNVCEESVQYSDGKDYCDRKVGEKALGLTSKFLAIGKRQADHVKEYRNVKDTQVVITGNPRFDLLRSGFQNVYAEGVNEIKNKIGKFILVNGNFALSNPHLFYGDLLVTLKKRKIISNAEQEIIWNDLYAYKSRMMQEFMEFIPKIASKFDCKVVVRPHPSENHDSWKIWAENHKKIIVAYEGSANEWMMAAEAVIHNGCTTGTEGFLLDRPMIAYVSDPDNEFSKDIVNDVSFQVNDEKQLMDAVEKVLNTGRFDSKQERHEKIKKLKYYIENTDGPLACDRIVEEIDRLDVPEHLLKDILNNLNGYKYACVSLIADVKDIVKKFIRGKKRYSIEYQKFLRISLEDMEKPLKIWKNENVITSIPTIKKIRENLFCLYIEK